MFLHHWRSGLWKEEKYALPHFCPSSMSIDSDSEEMFMGGIWSYNGAKQMCLNYRQAEKVKGKQGEI